MSDINWMGPSGMYVAFEDAQVRVETEQPVSSAQAKALAARVERAWVADNKTQRWDDQKVLRDKLTVAVLSPRSFAEFTGDPTGSVAGVTTGPDTIVMPDRLLGGASGDDENTIAHELAHVQDFREAGDAMNSVPTYLEEGKAVVIGDAWSKDRAHLQQSARTMASFTGDDVAYLLHNFRTASAERRPPQFVYAGEVMGALFVEYLATHVKKDAVVRICDAVEAAGDGKRFTEAFKKSFGISLTEAERRFTEFVRATEGDPQRRLAGTLYGG